MRAVRRIFLEPQRSALNSLACRMICGRAVVGSSDKGVPITNLSWLRSHMTNIGADFSLFNGKVNGSIEYFRRKRTGLPAARTNVLLPAELGYTLPL